MRIYAVVICLFFSVLCAAEEQPDYNDLTLDVIKFLPGFQELFASEQEQLPIDELYEKLGISGELMEFYSAMMLSALLYSDFDKDAIASMIKQFQEDIGEDVTGTLTSGQFQELIRRHNEFTRTRVAISGAETTMIGGTYAGAIGSWQTDVDEIESPINRTTVNCSSKTERCQEVMAKLDVIGPYYVLDIEERTYFVIHWDSREVIASSANRTCRRLTIRLDDAAQETTLTESNKIDRYCDVERRLGSAPPELDKPIISKLVSSMSVNEGQELVSRHGASWQHVNPRVLKRYKPMLEQALSRMSERSHQNEAKN